MAAPDKIYITEYNANVETGYFSRNKDDVFTQEYIRKDALMNYFHKRVEELNSPLNGVFGSTEREHCNERISELLLLIGKLNSM